VDEPGPDDDLGGCAGFIGWQTVLLVEVPVLMMGHGCRCLAVLCPAIIRPNYWEHQDEWEFAKAGLDGSSFYKAAGYSASGSQATSGFITSSLRPKIPNYKLQECHKENSIFHSNP